MARRLEATPERIERFVLAAWKSPGDHVAGRLARELRTWIEGSANGNTAARLSVMAQLILCDILARQVPEPLRFMAQLEKDDALLEDAFCKARAWLDRLVARRAEDKPLTAKHLSYAVRTLEQSDLGRILACVMASERLEQRTRLLVLGALDQLRSGVQPAAVWKDMAKLLKQRPASIQAMMLRALAFLREEFPGELTPLTLAVGFVFTRVGRGGMPVPVASGGGSPGAQLAKRWHDLLSHGWPHDVRGLRRHGHGTMGHGLDGKTLPILSLL